MAYDTQVCISQYGVLW